MPSWLADENLRHRSTSPPTNCTSAIPLSAVWLWSRTEDPDRSAGQYHDLVDSSTLALWRKQDRHTGDRKRLFTAVHDAGCGPTVLYPGSYVDIAASMTFPSVTYVDTDRRAARFFTDTDTISDIIVSEGGSPIAEVAFIHGDYTTELDLDHESFDLLVSLYSGFVSEACTDYLRVGGVLLVAPSHGDTAMASIDPRYTLSGVVLSRSGGYRVHTDSLNSYLQPMREMTITSEMLHVRRRGIPYTRSAFAYLFSRTT